MFQSLIDFQERSGGFQRVYWMCSECFREFHGISGALELVPGVFKKLQGRSSGVFTISRGFTLWRFRKFETEFEGHSRAFHKILGAFQDSRGF